MGLVCPVRRAVTTNARRLVRTINWYCLCRIRGAQNETRTWTFPALEWVIASVVDSIWPA